VSTFTQIFYHITFATKNRRAVLDPERRVDFFKYVWGIVRKHESHLYRINCVSDHLHLLTSVHPTVRLSDFVKDIKVASAVWIKDNRIFPAFDAWQEGYGAFTYANDDQSALIEYVKGQEEHHRLVSFREEFRALLLKAGLEFDEKYLD
jgi:REP element-mobilizing transposase RayT